MNISKEFYDYFKQEETEIIAEILRVDEPEFGCEGRPDGEVHAQITLKNQQKETVTVPIPEKTLYSSHLDDNVLIVRKQMDYWMWDENRKSRSKLTQETIDWIMAILK